METNLYDRVIEMRRLIDEMRLRLQALEQNTTPARPAEQKPREYWVNIGQGTSFRQCSFYETAEDAREMAMHDATIIHVREVL